MKRFFRITSIILASLVILISGILLLCLKSNTIHQEFIKCVNGEIPGSITLGRLRISLLAMRVEIRDLALADSSGTIVARFDRLAVDISPLALIRRVLVVQETVLERPWVRLDIDSSGQLTLLNAFPQNKIPEDTVTTRPKSVHASKPFLIELQKLNIIGGIAFFASQQDSLDVQAHGLAIKASGETGTLSGDLTFILDSASLKRNTGNLNLHDLSLMTRMKNMNIDTIIFKTHTAGSSLLVNGSVFSLKKDPLVNLSIDGTLSLSELRVITGIKEAIDGAATIQVKLNGNASNPELNLNITYGGGMVWGYPIQTLSLKTLLHDRILELNRLHADASAGSIDITGNIDTHKMFPQGFLNAPASLQELSYNLDITGNKVALKNIAPGISGTAAASIKLDGHGAHPDSLAATLGVLATVDALQLDTGSLPFDVSIACSTSVTNGVALVHALTGKFGHEDLSLKGMYGISSGEMNGTLTLSVPQMHEIGAFAGIDSISGDATIAISVEGNVKNPQASIKMNADTIGFGSLRIGSIALAAELEKDGSAAIKALTLSNQGSQLQLSGSSSVLRNGTPLPVDSMKFTCVLSSKSLNINDFVDSLHGIVQLDAEVNGTVNNPQGYIHLLASDLSAAGQHIAECALDAILDQKRITIQPLRIAITSGQDLTVSGWASLSDSFAIELRTKGLHLNTITALSSMDSLDGVVSIQMNADGTYGSPSVHGDLAIGSIRKGSLVLDDIGLHIDLHDQQIAVNGSVIGDLKAGYNIKTKAFSTDFAINNLNLKPYLALSGQNLDGSLTAALRVSGNADSLDAVSGLLHIANLDLAYDSIPLIATDKLDVSFEKKHYTVPNFKIGLADQGSLKGRADGSIDGAHDVLLNGTIPLSIVRYFSPDLSDIDGDIAIDVAFNGTPKNPNLNADMHLNNISMTIPGLSGQLHSLNGRILADRNAVRIETLKGNIDDGVLSMKGDLKLDNFTPSDLKAYIQLKSLPVSVPDMLDIVLDGDLQLAGNPDTTLFTGNVVLLDGVYYQNVVINPLGGMGQRKRKVSAPPAENSTPYLKNMHFNVDVQSRSPFKVDNNMAQLSIVPDIQLSGSIMAPTINGRANVEQGTITYHKKVFTVDKGIIDFVNPYAIEPQIDISGTVPVREYTIEITISGTPEDLVFKLSCDDADLEDQDLLSLLVLGKTTAELHGGIIGGGQSNQQMLASLVASTFGDDIKNATGLDILQIETGDQDDENSDRISITMGKQLTKHLETKYTVETEDGDVVQRATAEYRFLQNLNFAAFQDTKGVYGGEMRFTWEKR